MVMTFVRDYCRRELRLREGTFLDPYPPKELDRVKEFASIIVGKPGILPKGFEIGPHDFLRWRRIRRLKSYTKAQQKLQVVIVEMS